MSTSIEWTQRPGTKGETWNPVVGCTKVSQGCKNCYAKTIHDNRHKAYSEGKLQNVKQYAVPFEHVQLMPDRLTMPLKWKSPRTIFVNSVSDLFHEDVPLDYIKLVLTIAASSPEHTFQILTKRPERMAEIMASLRWHVGLWVNTIQGETTILHTNCFEAGKEMPAGWVPDNIWLGTSVEDQATADARIPYLLCCPAAVRFLSCEPLLGAVKLGGYYNIPGAPGIDTWNDGIHWVIVGGESGPKARPMHPDWARSLRDQCKAAGTAYFFKQWGEWAPTTAIDAAHGHPPERCMLFSSITGNTYYCVPSLSETERGQHMVKVGKAKAGRLLDGVEHSEWPRVGVTSNDDGGERQVRERRAAPDPRRPLAN
jgi:protein gp37